MYIRIDINIDVETPRQPYGTCPGNRLPGYRGTAGPTYSNEFRIIERKRPVRQAWLGTCALIFHCVTRAKCYNAWLRAIAQRYSTIPVAVCDE